MERLNLSNTNISDAGLKHLRELRNLNTLWLQDTAITDAGLRELHGHTQLKWLGLKGTLVTPEGIEELESIGVTDVIIAFRNVYNMEPDADLETKIQQLNWYAGEFIQPRA